MIMQSPILENWESFILQPNLLSTSLEVELPCNILEVNRMQFNSERIMKLMIQSIRNGCFFAGITLLALTVPAVAQGGVVAHSGDVAVNVGFGSQSGNDTLDRDKHPSYGASGAYNFTKHVAFLGEYSYLSLGSEHGIDGRAELLGVGARYSLLPSKRIVPYVVAAMDLDRFSISQSASGITETESTKGFYLGLGGGASFYATNNWGIRPELRWEYQNFPSGPFNDSIKTVRGTVSLFYQWGGKGMSKN